MSTQTIFRKVPVTERLPKISGSFFTNHQSCYFSVEQNEFCSARDEGEIIEWWLEEVQLSLSPKEIKAQSCPICNGEGKVPTILSTNPWKICDVCNGEKIIYPSSSPILPTNEEIEKIADKYFDTEFDLENGFMFQHGWRVHFTNGIKHLRDKLKNK